MIGHGASAPARSLVAGAIARSIADTAAATVTIVEARFWPTDEGCYLHGPADCGCESVELPKVGR